MESEIFCDIDESVKTNVYKHDVDKAIIGGMHCRGYSDE